jgi:hypothetical protein
MTRALVALSGSVANGKTWNPNGLISISNKIEKSMKNVLRPNRLILIFGHIFQSVLSILENFSGFQRN